MSSIFGIDPGPEQSGYAILYGDIVIEGGVLDNDVLVEKMRRWPFRVAIEMIASYGMPVGREVFETCVWIGRLVEARVAGSREYPLLVYRREVKAYLCAGDPKAKDANITQAIKDRFERTGGGKNPVVGTKKKPGPLYGFSSHAWAALGVAITARDTK